MQVRGVCSLSPVSSQSEPATTVAAQQHTAVKQPRWGAGLRVGGGIDTIRRLSTRVRPGGGRSPFMSVGRAQRQRQKLHIRWMIRRDMPDVLAAERASFEYAWTEDDFLRCLRQRNCIGMVAEGDDPVGPAPGVRGAGVMIYELPKPRLHILNFAVHPLARRTGIGGQMLGKLVHKLTTHRRLKITLAVRERNIDAQVFFRDHDFRATKV